jgi:hypothetical protein
VNLPARVVKAYEAADSTSQSVIRPVMTAPTTLPAVMLRTVNAARTVRSAPKIVTCQAAGISRMSPSKP